MAPPAVSSDEKTETSFATSHLNHVNEHIRKAIETGDLVPHVISENAAGASYESSDEYFDVETDDLLY